MRVRYSKRHIRFAGAAGRNTRLPLRTLALLLFTAIAALSQYFDSLSFWREAIKEPLSGLDAKESFRATYEDALIPGPAAPGLALEGTVVSFVSTLDGHRVFLSMEGKPGPEVALSFESDSCRLQSEPAADTVVQFIGVAREFTEVPFTITFEPVEVDGLDLAPAGCGISQR